MLESPRNTAHRPLAAAAHAAVLVSLAFANACDSDGTAARADAGVEADAAPEPLLDAAGPDANPDPTVVDSRDATIGPISAAPGEEDTVCAVVELGNVEPRMIRAVRSELSLGTHHVIASLTDDPVTAQPFSCGAFSAGSTQGVLFIAQQSEARLDYPPGAGLAIAPRQHIFLEMHYINAQGDGDLAISGTVSLDLADDDGALQPVQLLFTGDLSLDLPPATPVTSTSFSTLPEGVALFAATAHTHQWGQRATVHLATSVDDPGALLLHDSTNWAERPLDVFEPLTITAGQGLRLSCEFLNGSPNPVGFGTSANDEMCFVWAHYVAP